MKNMMLTEDGEMDGEILRCENAARRIVGVM